MTDFVFTLSSGDEIPVIITTRRGLRNITLRPKFVPKREVHISKPWLVSTSAAIRFLKSKQRWLECVFQKCSDKIMLKSGDKIEFFVIIKSLILLLEIFILVKIVIILAKAIKAPEMPPK